MAPRSKVWNGQPSLAKLLVPVESLTPHPRNPRRGDVDRIATLLDRFGQLRPILVDEAGLILAGNHTYRAGVERHGWTHIAVVAATTLSEAEKEAYLVADNAASDAAGWDERELSAILRERFDAGDLAATGWTEAEYRDLMAGINAALAPARGGEPPEAFPPVDPGTLETHYRCPSCRYEWSGDPKPE